MSRRDEIVAVWLQLTIGQTTTQPHVGPTGLGVLDYILCDSRHIITYTYHIKLPLTKAANERHKVRFLRVINTWQCSISYKINWKVFDFNSVPQATISSSSRRRGGSESRCFVMELFKMEVELLSDTFSRAGDTFKLFNFSTPVMYPTLSYVCSGNVV